MKAIYSIEQLRHSSNVGGATQHNGWHPRDRPYCRHGGNLEIIQDLKPSAAGNRRSGGDKRPFRRPGASCGLPKCRSARRSTCSRKSEAKRPARIFVSSTQAIRRRHACIWQPGALWIWKRGAFAARRDDMISLQQAQMRAIPYENFDVLLGDIADLTESRSGPN